MGPKKPQGIIIHTGILQWVRKHVLNLRHRVLEIIEFSKQGF